MSSRLKKVADTNNNQEYKTYLYNIIFVMILFLAIGISISLILPLLIHRTIPASIYRELCFYLIAGLFTGSVMAAALFVDNRWCKKIYEFPEMGQSIEIAPGIREAEDGTYRLRCATRDIMDNSSKQLSCFPHFHFEVVDKESGLITENYIVEFPRQAGKPPIAIRRWFARIESNAPRFTKHYIGLPIRYTKGCDRRKCLSNPSLVILEEYPEGFWATRFDEKRQYAGDTWHINRESAILQLTAEFGSDCVWKEIPEDIRSAVKYAFSYNQQSTKDTYLRASTEPMINPEILLRPTSTKNNDISTDSRQQ